VSLCRKELRKSSAILFKTTSPAEWPYVSFNRGYVDDRLAIELSRASRYGKSLAVAVIDADRFKSLNAFAFSSGHL
jgi:GGDEF domain-containing protein